MFSTLSQTLTVAWVFICLQLIPFIILEEY